MAPLTLVALANKVRYHLAPASALMPRLMCPPSPLQETNALAQWALLLWRSRRSTLAQASCSNCLAHMITVAEFAFLGNLDMTWSQAREMLGPGQGASALYCAASSTFCARRRRCRCTIVAGQCQ